MLQYAELQREISMNKKIFSFLVVFMAFAHTYGTPGASISFGELLMFIGIPLYFKSGLQVSLENYERGFVLWFVYMTIISMIMGIVYDAPMTKYFSIARAGFYWVLIFYFGKNLFNRKIFEKWMIVFSVALSVFILVQFLTYMLAGFYIPGLIYGLPISNGSENGMATYQHSLNMAKWFGVLRPHGFLAEPAHASQFLFISIVTLICNKNLLFKKKIFLVILFSSSVVMTQSTTGIILLGLAWLLFMIVEERLSVYRLPFFMFFFIMGIYVLFGGVETSLSAIERVVNIVNGSEIDGSSNVRLNNGLEVFSDLPFVFKVFGTGAGLSEFVFNSLDFKSVSSYMNALAGIFFNTGVIGGLIWLASLVIMFVKSGLLGKSLVVGFFTMTLGCSIYCQPQMVWFFLLILADIKEKNDRYSCVKL